MLRVAGRRSLVGGWLSSLLMPHLTLILISFVPPNTWTTEALPPELGGVNYTTLFSETERLRPAVNSLWMAAVATIGALVLGFAAAQLSRGRKGLLPWLLQSLVVFPWAIPGTVFAIALASAFSVHQPWFARIVARRHRGPAAARLSGSKSASHRSSGTGGSAVSWTIGWKRPRRRSVPAQLVCSGASPCRCSGQLWQPEQVWHSSPPIGDFVASIVLYTFETRPISIEILSSLRQQETGVAAAYGVLLMLVSASAFLIWGRGTPNA